MTTTILPQRDAELETVLATHWPGGPVYAFDVVASTMDIAHALAQDGAPEWTLVWAQRQEQGRGQRGRAWMSPEGGLYCSIILRPTKPVVELPQLTLVVGEAVKQAIEEVTGLSLTIKHPNDLFLNGKKLCGILTERKTDAVVVGIGININVPLSELPETATSLSVAGATDNPLELMGTIYHHLSHHYVDWLQP